MKTNLTTVHSVLAAAVMCFALDASALTVGRLKGSALLGQPFEAVASFQLAQDEDVSEACVEAAIAYGDVPQPLGQTVVKLTPGPKNQNVLAIITSSGIVNEPVVTIDLKVGCTQKTTRRFVLLADLASDSAANSAQAVVASRPPASVSNFPASPTPTIAAATNLADNKPNVRLPRKDVDKAKMADSTPPTLQKLAQGSPVQSTTATLSSDSVEDLKRRIEAVAQWQATKTAAQEVQPNAASIDSLQDNLKLLQVVTLKNQKSIEAVSSALETSEAQRVAPSLVYGVLVLVVLSLAGLAYLLFRSGRGAQPSTPWWGTSADDQTRAAVTAEKPAGAKKTVNQPLATQTQQLPIAINPIAAKPLADAVDIELGESAFAGIEPVVAPEGQTTKISEPKRAEKRDFAQSGSATLRAINTKEMFDVRQQADFFMALGQHDEAIQVLERSNAESEESNPLVLLDLLKILHTLSRRADFERYRSEFNLLFTGIVPPYANFLDEGKSLESYIDIVQQVISLWPTDDTMDYIEQCMVRTPEDDPLQGFDLEAFRELLVLHGILRRLDTDVDSTMAPFSASRTVGAVLLTDTADGADVPFDGGSTDLILLPVLSSEPIEPIAAPEVDLDLTDNNSPDLMDFDISGILGADEPKS